MNICLVEWTGARACATLRAPLDSHSFTMPQLPPQNESPLGPRKHAKSVVFEDPKSKELLAQIRALALTDGTLLIVGEPGTGKELVARLVHEWSARAERPLLTVSCGALSETHALSELFGHTQELPSGAVGSKEGWFEAADGGTLLLDDI